MRLTGLVRVVLSTSPTNYERQTIQGFSLPEMVGSSPVNILGDVAYIDVQLLVLHPRFSREKDSALFLLLFFSLNVWVAMRFIAETRGVLEMRNFTPAYI